jgi:hypothetical protein
LSLPEHSSWISSEVASWAFLRLNHGGRQCWGVTRKIRMIPLTQEREFLTRSSTRLERWETVISPADCTSPENLNLFTRALAPPFIGRRRDFYIPKTPSISENIPSVNAYKNVFLV